ncbi:DnaJ like chaperone protein [Halanaerobium saccharolyticum]|uniref:DnaJ like chaperone protein n=1 Tax=Halanaerobium saccharolyticum TaxID=43595 RepID=A0A4R7YV12_9FIRM|nr:co-chaperone DjlA [Halanaerobium saccharolyticum]RAK06935.1 DnaJ like chaperone protein [Halanaerobium saccharolyticum]TDW01662.1 DnaJ like chaperone protein [Halanaerobium saccharolyticum]TDX53060.1 DnaJ like chaperone protein [Halanaerobium saccharolyticum]
MAWMGKILGGTVGWSFGGPLGAVIGAAIGNHFDQSGSSNSNGNQFGAGQRGNLNQQEEKQTIFFTSIFSMLAKFAQADGTVSRSEIKTIDRFIKNELKLQGEARRLAISIFDEAKRKNNSFEEYAQQFYDNFKNEQTLVLGMFDLLLKVAVADNDFHHKEEQYIKKAKKIFKINDSQYESIRSQYLDTNDLEKYYKILECSPEADFKEVKRQYRKKAKDFHPDNVIGKGLPEEFVDFAEQEFKKINNAYETIKAERSA